MSRCLRCGQDNEKTARFCVGCGAQLSQDLGHSSVSEESKSRAEAASAAKALAGSQPSSSPQSGSQPPSPQPGRLTPHGSPHVSRNSAPGLLPALIVPGTAGLGTRDDFETADPTPSRGGAPSASLAFAETAPPLVETDLNRPIPDRGARQARHDSDPGDPRMTFPPPEPQEPLRHQPASGPSLDPLSVPSDSPRILSGFLVSYEGNALGQSWSVYQGSNLVGRLGAVAGADIELPHATVSSQHAMLRAAAHPGRLILRDQNSTNGSFVNDTALQPDELRELRDGDRVRFGLFTLIVKII